MKCPTCVADGERSHVRVGGTTTTSMATDTYYDEDGVFHDHNPNWHATAHACSRGHRWTERWLAKCPAGDYPPKEHGYKML